MAVTLSFSLEKADLRRMGYIGLRARPLVFWGSVSFFVFLPLLAAAVAVISAYGNSRFSWIPVLILLAVPVLSVAGFYNLPVVLFGKSPALRGEHKYLFDVDDIHLKNPAFDSRISWQIITSCFVHSFGILFYSGKAPIISVPRGALSGSIKAELLKLVRQKGIRIEGKA